MSDFIFVNTRQPSRHGYISYPCDLVIINLSKYLTDMLLGGSTKHGPVTYIPPPISEEETDIFEQHVVKGINFDKYDDITVECTGSNVPLRGISR